MSCRMPLPPMFPDWPAEGNYLALSGTFTFSGGAEGAKRAASGVIEPDEGHLEGLPPGIWPPSASPQPLSESLGWMAHAGEAPCSC